VSLRERVRPTLAASAYVLAVAATAAVGFTAESTATILLAALVALPGSIAAVPGYYMAYGLLALVPGANPSRSSGSGSCAPDGSCHRTVVGDPAVWFTITTDALGILALTGAALVNVVVFRTVMARRRGRGGAMAPRL
jgi:hypothetical protein